jgi:hypothetical protein
LATVGIFAMNVAGVVSKSVPKAFEIDIPPSAMSNEKKTQPKTTKNIIVHQPPRPEVYSHIVFAWQ